MLHPEVAFRDCDHCQKWAYNHETGELELFEGEPIEREGLPPCGHSSSLCKKESPTAGKELDAMGWNIYDHYCECKATSLFENDPAVKKHASIIRQVEDNCERVMLAELLILSQVPKV